jgi:hypothetical protein
MRGDTKMDKALDWNCGLPASNHKAVVKAIQPAKIETKAESKPEDKGDGLPEIVSLPGMFHNPPPEPPELIYGVMRRGGKCLLTGDSKAGKTFIAMYLGGCLATGSAFLDMFSCSKCKVLYCNFELEDYSVYKRMQKIFEANGWSFDNIKLDFWNLRGFAAPIEQLVDKIIPRCAAGEYDAVIFDPLYKIQSGDENKAGDMASVTNAFDRICKNTGASVIYVHHHSKKFYEKAIDRGSGSGVLTRDCDALIDISPLELGEDQKITFKDKIEAGAQALNYSFVLRDFPAITDLQGWFEFPLHKIDKTGLLEGTALTGSGKANLKQNGSNKAVNDDKLDRAFKAVQKGGEANINDIIQYIGKDKRTIERWISDSPRYAKRPFSSIVITKEEFDEKYAYQGTDSLDKFREKMDQEKAAMEQVGIQLKVEDGPYYKVDKSKLNAVELAKLKEIQANWEEQWGLR